MTEPTRRDHADLVRRAATVLCAVVAALLLQGSTLLPPAPVGQDRPAVLPDPFPAYSHLASTVEDTPPGPALMGFTHGLGVEFLDTPQAVVLGADGTTYRHLQTALSGTQPFLLSPDGSAVAVGTTGAGGRLGVVDLETGQRQWWTVRKGSSALPAAWSADSTSVFVTTPGEAWDVFSEPAPLGGWGLLRVDSRAGTDGVATLPVQTRAESAVAALPDGGGLLVAAGGVTELRTADGARLVSEDTGVPPGLVPGSVSPDGRSAVTVRGPHTGPVEITPLRDGRADGTPRHLAEGLLAAPLGWLDDRRVLVGSYDAESTALRLHLWAVDAVTGEREELLVAEPGWTGASVTGISVAGDLLDGATVQPVGGVDRGYVFVAMRVMAWVLVVVLAHRLWRGWRARRDSPVTSGGRARAPAGTTGARLERRVTNRARRTGSTVPARRR